MSEHTQLSTEHSEAEQSHGMTFGTYIMVWFGLVALTAITVTISGIHLGSLTLIAALVIASIKSSLVVTFFMHVKYDNNTIKVFIFVCLLIFIIIMILTFSDLSFR